MADINSTTLMCTTSRHVAGSYLVTVLIEGIGRASGDVCFHYLLTLNSVSPNVGGISGGYEITLTGEGFLELYADPKESLYDIAYVPWLRHGIGLPYIESVLGLNICPNYAQEPFRKMFLTDDYEHFKEEKLRTVRENFSVKTGHSICSDDDTGYSSEKQSHYTSINTQYLNDIYNILPSSVTIGGFPCIITRASIDNLNCIMYLASPGQFNISVSMFSEIAVLESAFTFEAERTPTIATIEPAVGAVIGGYTLAISGMGFKPSGLGSNQDVFVSIGDAACSVEFANESYIACIVESHQPGFLPVWVVTFAGVAVWEKALQEPNRIFEEVTNQNNSINSSIFPIYEYRLSATVETLVYGSIAGGAEVVIKGGDFFQGITQVFIGELPAEIVSLERDTLVVVTPSSSRTEHIALISQIKGKGVKSMDIQLSIV